MRNGAREKEAVERKRGADFLFAGLYLERLHEHKPDNAEGYGNRKNDCVAERFVKKHPGHRAGGKGQVDADSEITDAFASATCGKRVNSHRIACGTGNPEEQPVGKAHDGKDRQQSDNLVAYKTERKCEKCPKV